ncbi:MAG TPA: hypothetical protein VG407_18070 [Caulobacteraceae bacterium]|nr:hypothetical protein [Caulobacteraceae bacterium]
MKINSLLTRRIGGAVLLIIALVFLAGPVQRLMIGFHPTGPVKSREAYLDMMTYQLTLGGVLALFGAYFLTKKPQNPTAKPDAADQPRS